MKIKLLFVYILFVLGATSLTSCEYEPLDPAIDTTVPVTPINPGENPGETPGENPGNPGETPGETPGENPGSSSGDYLPLAINNRWTYSRSGADNYDIRLIEMSNFGGINFYKSAAFTSTGAGEASGDLWLGKSAGDYYSKYGSVSFNAGGYTGTQQGYDMLILKDYIAQGATWEGNFEVTTTYTGGSIPPVTMNNHYVGTILEKQVSAVVNNITYPDVIKVKIVRTISMMGQTTNTITSHYWFAKNVGIIKTVHEDVSAAGTTNTTEELIGYALN